MTDITDLSAFRASKDKPSTAPPVIAERPPNEIERIVASLGMAYDLIDMLATSINAQNARINAMGVLAEALLTRIRALESK